MRQVVEDSGHGGSDRGNVGISRRYVEADGTLAIGKAFDAAISEYNNISCTRTRYIDKTVSLTARGRMASGAFLFLSNHTNAAGDPGIDGVEVFYSVDHPEDKDAAAKLSALLATVFDIPDRGAKVRPGINDPSEDYYTVIDVADDVGCKHVFLVEAMFHSNPDAEEKLLDPAVLEEIGQIEAEFFADYYGFTKKSDVSEWAKAAQAWVKETGISDGLRPKDPVTREEVWTMLYQNELHRLEQSISTLASLLEATKTILENRS